MIGVIVGDFLIRILYVMVIFLFCAKYMKIREFVLIPLVFIGKTIPILIIGYLLSLLFPQIYFIPINLLIFLGLFVIWIRYGSLISAWEIDNGFSFLPNKMLKIIKKILIK